MPLPHPITLIAHDIRSAYNVGSLFRTADSAGLAEVILTGYTPTPDHRGVAKTALGAQDAVAWRQIESLAQALTEVRADGGSVAALERVPEAILPNEVPADRFPLALVLGNEVEGVSKNLLGKVDLVVGLPQYGVKASLNVSVACGVAAYGLVARYRSVCPSTASSSDGE